MSQSPAEKNAQEIAQKEWSDEFPILRELAFFNHAGVAPICARAGDAMRNYADQATRAAYLNSGWDSAVKPTKAAAASLINAASGEEIAFVPNTSSGISLVAKGLRFHAGENVVITNVEYPANRYPWEDLRRLGVELREVAQSSDGVVDAEDVMEAIDNRTRVVAISHVQYASGCRIDLRPIGEMVHRAGGLLCVDAIQSMGVLPVDVREMGIDFLAADGHKWLLAPEGFGVFYCREDLIEALHPNVVGWMNMVNASDYGNYQFEFQKDARRFEPGSYNIAGMLGFAASVGLLSEVGITNIWARVEALTDRLCAGLTQRGYRVFSPRGSGQKSGIVTFEPPGMAPVMGPRGRPVEHPGLKRIVAELEKQGIVIVVREGRLRASPHFYNTDAQIDRLVAALP